jgi:hypothetical protein
MTELHWGESTISSADRPHHQNNNNILSYPERNFLHIVALMKPKNILFSSISLITLYSVANTDNIFSVRSVALAS